jgi:hypothetical protein
VERVCRFLDLLTAGDPEAQLEDEEPTPRRRRRRRSTRHSARQSDFSDAEDDGDAEDGGGDAFSGSSESIAAGDAWAADPEAEAEEVGGRKVTGSDDEDEDDDGFLGGADERDSYGSVGEGDFADMRGKALLSCGMKVKAVLTKSGRLALTGEEKHFCALRAQNVMQGHPDFVHVVLPVLDPGEPPENEVRAVLLPNLI